MDEPSTTSDNLDEIDEDILSHTVSDEALEATAGYGRNVQTQIGFSDPYCALPNCVGRS